MRKAGAGKPSQRRCGLGTIAMNLQVDETIQLQTAERLSQPPWLIIDFTLAFKSQHLADMVAYWESKRRGRPMPSRGDIDPLELRDHLGYIVLINIIGEPARFQYRLVGTSIVQEIDRDSTGRFVDEIYSSDRSEALTGFFRYLVKEKCPAHNYGNARWADKDHKEYEAVTLPLSDDGERVDMFLCRMAFGAMATMPARVGSALPSPSPPQK